MNTNQSPKEPLAFQPVANPDQPVNVYICPAGHKTVTREIHQGVTPMRLACRGKRGCSLIASSSFYYVGLKTEPPTFEWYMPESLEGFSEGMKDHIRQGGLVLREIGKTKPAKPAPAKSFADSLRRKMRANNLRKLE